MCNFLDSVLLQQRFEWVDQCYSLVTAQSFIWQTKGSTPLRHEDRPTPKERPQPTLAPSFYTFCILSPEPALCKLGLARKGACLFHLRFSLRSKDFSFVPFLCAFSILYPFSSVHFSQSVSHVWLFVTPWAAACQASLSITSSRSLLKLMSIKWVMPSINLILLSPSPPIFNLSQHQGLFKWVGALLHMAKGLELQLQHQFFQWIFRTVFL